MSYCVDKGIPHSEFLDWSPEDRAKTIAYIQEQSLQCTLCGTSEWEWEEDPFAYTTEEKWCKGCYNKSMASEDAGKMPGTTVVLTPSTQAVLDSKKAARDRQVKMKAEASQD